jgi:GNAT superfamily N-acetyltransferase
MNSKQLNISVKYDVMAPGEEKHICDLVLRVFDQFVAPDYPEEGILEFKSYITPEQLIERSKGEHDVLVARHAHKFVGVIDIRQHHHISLFFVDADFQNQGIGKVLFQKVIALCKKKVPGLNQTIYKRLGFQETEGEQFKNGMRFQPMSLDLTNLQPNRQ